MKKMGFTNKWVAWIKAALSSSWASVLLNGAPTEEFRLQRGLRQGDPLSPFLFVLAMEGFHIALEEVAKAGVFRGVSIGCVGLHVSHFLYADDVVLLCDWGVENARRIIRIMRVFHLASGLKINLLKSKLIGVGVDYEEVQEVADLIGCSATRIPFVYLGVPIGGNMNRVDAWKPMVDRFVAKMSVWEAKLLSIGGRLTLIKAVLGSLAIYYMSIYKVPDMVLKMLEALRARFFWGADMGERKLQWIAWSKILPSKEAGGLGIGSLSAFNNALLFKWLWRFKESPNALWARVVAAIHGRLDRREGLGDGKRTRFWLDHWIGNRPLAEEVPRLFALESEPEVAVFHRNIVEKIFGAFVMEPRRGVSNAQWEKLQSLMQGVAFHEAPDRYEWELEGSGAYSVASARLHIDSVVLGDSGVMTRWNKLVPRKLNILMWRVLRDRIPTRLNLRDKGIDLHSVLCPGCDVIGESTRHLFVTCIAFSPIWHRMAMWWGVPTPSVLSVDALVRWADGVTLNREAKMVFDAVIIVAFWNIWSVRNKLVFDSNPKSSTDSILSPSLFICFQTTSPKSKRSMAVMNDAGANELPVKLEGKFLAIVVCWILGFGSLVAWNSMLTIGDYYYAVFPDYHPSRVLTLVYQPFAIGTIAILAYHESKIDTRKRNIAGYTLFFVCTLALIVIDLASSGKGGIGNYIAICIFVAGFGIADAHVQGGMVGDLAFMKPEFMQSFLAGLGASGIVTSGLRLVTKAAFDKSSNGLRKGTMLFLGISTFSEFICIFLYAYVFGIQTEPNGPADIDGKVPARLSTKQLLVKNIDYALDLYLIYVLTLSIFPGFLYENTGKHQLGSWYPLVLIAVYNLWDLVARYIPLIQYLKIESRKWLMICTLARFLFVPAFYFTAKYSDQGWMIMLISFLGLTNGYLTICVMTVAPKGCTGPEANALGNILVMFLLCGIFTGVALDWLWIIGNGNKSTGLLHIYKSKFREVMAVDDSSQTPARLEGKFGANIICWILGIGSLICWNSLTSMEDYYYDVFPDYHPSRVLTLVYQPFAFGIMAFLAYNESRIDTRKRNILGYTMFFLATLALILLDLATNGKGSIESYIGVCIFVAAFGAADALVQGGMIGDLALMCPEFIQSFLAGMAASGALTSALRLLTEAVFNNYENGLRTGALLFLSISTLFVFLCIFLYAFIFTKLPIVKHYRRKAALEGSQTVSSDLSAAGIHTDLTQKLVVGDLENLDRLTNKQLLLENFDYALDLFLVYTLTLSIFPGFLYENTGNHQLGSWYPLVLVATFNVWDFLSRYIPLIEHLKLESRKGLMIFVMSRFLLVPAFYVTAKYGDQGWMILLVSILGLSNGYLSVCVLMAAPKGYKGPEQNAMGNLLVLFLLGGITLGAALDWLWLIGNGSFLDQSAKEFVDFKMSS
ncbi:hypothetical protein LXL04_010120 [Taraxacum kok-saghyz]